MTRYLLLFAMLGCAHYLSAQEYSLPKADVLRAEKIMSIKLYQHLLNPLQGWVESEPRSAKDTIVTTYPKGTYYFSEFGLLDSLDYGNEARFEGVRIAYDDQGRVNYFFESTATRANYKEMTMKPDAGGWLYEYKMDGKLIEFTRLNADSIPLMQVKLRGKDSIVQKYSPSSEEFTRMHYVDGKLGANIYHHWIVKDGVPDSLIVESEFFSKDVIRHYALRQNRLYSGRFKVKATGEIIVSEDSPFYTGLQHFNFNMRQNKFSGITPYVLNAFRADSLLPESLIIDSFSFNGSTKREYFEIVYERR